MRGLQVKKAEKHCDKLLLTHCTYSGKEADLAMFWFVVHLESVNKAFMSECVQCYETIKAMQEIEPNGVHMAWQIIQYFLMTCGEVVFSVTGLDFSYSQVWSALWNSPYGETLTHYIMSHNLAVLLFRHQAIWSQSSRLVGCWLLLWGTSSCSSWLRQAHFQIRYTATLLFFSNKILVKSGFCWHLCCYELMGMYVSF